jgi:hypothetical protein
MTKLQKKSVNINNTEIDSFKLRIPYTLVEVIDSRLEGTKTTWLNETSEVLKEFKDNALLIKENGVSIRFGVETIPIDSKGNSSTYVTILINSKLLTNRYLEGITKDNIDVVYNEIMSKNVVKFRLQDMFEGFCTDADFKTDTEINKVGFNELLNYFKSNAKESSDEGKGCRVFKQHNNNGIQFSNRATTKFKTNPFWKLYHKGVELEFNSLEFNETYLKGIDTKNRIRFEYAIKNNKHLKSLGIESNTLSHLLNLDDATKKRILSETIKTHLIGNMKVLKVKEGIAPMDELLHNLITMQMNGEKSYSKIRDFILSTFTDKVAKSRCKSKLDGIYNNYIKGSKEDVSTKEIAGVLDLIGVQTEIG